MRNDPLSITALRYAARDLPAVETAAFEARLATDAQAQDALAEAVRLSAAALGQPAPVPMTGLRGMIADRLNPVGLALGGLFGRRAYRGHPLTWAGLGAIAAAVAVTTGVWLANPAPTSQPDYAAVCAPAEAASFVVAKPAETDPVASPRADAGPPKPMQSAVTAVVPSTTERNPMGGGGEPSPPVNRPRTFLPENDPPGMNPDDVFRPFDPSSGS